MLVKYMLAGCPVRGGLHCRKLISSNVLSWFIEKMEALKYLAFVKMSQKSSPIPTHSDNALGLFLYLFILKRVEMNEDSYVFNEKCTFFSTSVVSNVKMCANPHHSVGSCPVIFESSVSSFVHNMDQWLWFSGCE